MAKYKVVITDREYEDIDNELRILQELGDVEVLDYQLRDEDQVIASVPKRALSCCNCA